MGRQPAKIDFRCSRNQKQSSSLKVTDAQVSFIEDESGEVVNLILHQGGANQPAAKIE